MADPLEPQNIEEERRAMAQVKTVEKAANGESGFALVLAILSLMLLTFLGLTMATTTSTELQIATNYRWSQQALYNAEAGIELGKRYLRQIEWQTVLPSPRTDFVNYGGYGGGNCAAGNASHCPTPFLTRATRSFENYACDQDTVVAAAAGYQGYGMVLDDINFAVPFENVSTFLGSSLNGNFTIWIRRPYKITDPPAAPGLEDDPRNDRLVLTSEGIAPYKAFTTANAASAFAQANQARRIMEVTLQRIAPGDCENRTAQTGSGPLGAGFDQCDPIQAQGILGGVIGFGGVQ
jgi:Tfp pilus assembly protein PilX